MDVDLLVATYAYPPMRFPRAVQIARALSGLDEQRTTIVCADEPESSDAELLAAYPDGGRRVVRVPWTRSAATYRRVRDRMLETRLLVPDRFRPWLRSAEHEIRRRGLLREGTVLVTFGQPMSVHLLGLRLRRRRHVRWLAHFSDPWTDSSFRSGGRVSRGLNRRLERQVVEKADRLVFTSDETVDLVLAKYPPEVRAKARVLPHAFDPSLYPPLERQDGPIVFRYLGALYGARGAGPLIAAVRVLQARRPDLTAKLRVELVGSQETPLGEDALAGLPEGLVTVHPPVPYLRSLALMRASDGLLVLDAPGEHSVFLPSKLVDYLGARRTVVALTPPGAAAALVTRAGGSVADPADPAAGAEALAAGLELAQKLRGRPFGTDALVEQYSLTRVSNLFAELVAETARG